MRLSFRYYLNINSLKCTEAPDEPESVSTETLYQLSCFIDKGKGFLKSSVQLL